MASEIAELRKRLEAEYIAGRRALYAPAGGWAKHAFIEARLRNMERCHQRLCELVGPEQALEMVYQVFERGDSLLQEREAEGQEGERERATPAGSVAGPGKGAGEPGGEGWSEEREPGPLTPPLAASCFPLPVPEPAPAAASTRLVAPPEVQSQAAEDPSGPPKTLWLLACSAAGPADLLSLFYAANEDEALALAHSQLCQKLAGSQVRALHPLPEGLTLPHGRYRGLIHLRDDGSIREGDYFLARSSVGSSDGPTSPLTSADPLS
ncbi:hypothetical protein [Thermogemmatispora sp.]|uniref:hypothetical protein n=1 Tax=Thermogemmatispora sp. TaxID=1968838 RepID=UPI0035E42D17